MKITCGTYKKIHHSINDRVNLFLLCIQYYFFLLYFLKIDTFKALSSRLLAHFVIWPRLILKYYTMQSTSEFKFKSCTIRACRLDN